MPVINLDKIKKYKTANMSLGDLIDAIAEKDHILESCVIYRDETGDICMVSSHDARDSMNMLFDFLDIVCDAKDQA